MCCICSKRIDKIRHVWYARGMFSPSEVVDNYVGIARGKAEAKWYKLLILSVLAGAFIALGGALATVAGAYAGGSSAALVKGAVFPVGLMLVVVCGAELFTGNCLMIAPTIDRHVRVRGLLKNLGIVYLGNLVGGVLIAVLVVFSHVMPEDAALAAVTTAAAKSSLGFGDAFLRGILCNVLVCLAVIVALSSKSIVGKILGVYLPVFAFVVLGFEHSVANMYYLSAGLMQNALGAYGAAAAGLSLGNALAFCLIPSTLGNIVGGAVVGIAQYYAFRPKPDKPNDSAT